MEAIELLFYTMSDITSKYGYFFIIRPLQIERLKVTKLGTITSTMMQYASLAGSDDSGQHSLLRCHSKYLDYYNPTL